MLSGNRCINRLNIENKFLDNTLAQEECMFVCVCVYINIYLYISIYTYRYICVHVCIYMCSVVIVSDVHLYVSCT